MPRTAFVAHPDCSRHDTGWRHPDHQGRLPALVRALERDMLTLHGNLLEVEAAHASETDLLRVHTPEYLDLVRGAVARAGTERTIQWLNPDTPISGATWDAATAAAGTGLSAIDAVSAGEAENAFCAARPPGRGASPGSSGEFSIFNNVAVAARCLAGRHAVRRLLMVDWGADSESATAAIFAADPVVEFLPWNGAPECLAESAERVQPEWILLSATLGRDPDWTFRCTSQLRDCARSFCDGRLVSLLEGGYDAPALGRSVVQHVRALAGLPPA